MIEQNVLYAIVILPIKFYGEVVYILPNFYAEEYYRRYYSSSQEDSLFDASHTKFLQDLVGQRVQVTFGTSQYNGVIHKVLDQDSFEVYKLQNQKKLGWNRAGGSYEYKVVDNVLQERVTKEEILLWEQLSNYYLCSIGEVFKAAYPIQKIRQESVKSKFKPQDYFAKIDSSLGEIDKLPTILSQSQSDALEKIRNNASKTTLLYGVTGSGKTEIYIKLITDSLQKGQNVLYLVPEIAVSKQLETRLKAHFGDRLQIYHSSQSHVKKKLIHSVLSCGDSSESEANPNRAIVVIGTRSAIFLPFRKLGLIIVDEEHDSSYKQDEPAPRYNARDAAILLSKIHKCQILLGSATPSLESIYNCNKGLYKLVEIDHKYFNAPNPNLILIDTLWAKKQNQMIGNFSNSLVHHIKERLEKEEQVILFCNLRSYSPMVQCSDCGEIVKCPHCNVSLSYHKFDNTLKCHYCEFSLPFKQTCPHCHHESLELKGAGTEKIEEEIRALFPASRVERYDADITKNRKKSDDIIERFDKGEIDILVGTQMISKGFDFANLTLVGVLQTDVLFGQQDFRADEKSWQLLVQLIGRVGRREQRGLFVVQTNNVRYQVIEQFKNFVEKRVVDYSQKLQERETFKFPPYIRLVNIIIKNRNPKRLHAEAEDLSKILRLNLFNIAVEITGPYTHRYEKINGEFMLCFSVKLARNKDLMRAKSFLYEIPERFKISSKFIIDVDPN